MASAAEASGANVRVVGRDEAEHLIADLAAVMAELGALVEAETQALRAGRVREGLSGEARKSELAAAYLRRLEAVKANAVALARFAPERLDGLRAGHARLAAALDTNQTVLATVRAVAEALVRGVSDELGRSQRPQAYGRAGAQPPRPAAAEPLVVSRRL